LRRRVVQHGRAPTDIAVFLGRTAVVGRTRKQAEEKYQEYHRHASIEGALAHFSSSTGIDLSLYELDEPIRYEKNNALNSAVEAITTLSREPWTLRRIIGQMGLGSRTPPIIGSADEVADELISWVREADIDGSNLSRIVTPESLEDFVGLVVPILQERGVYKREYAPGSLREKLFGHARLADTHPGAQYRRLPPSPQRSAAE
jgi:alkanesulfonate monooxygenase SsuD/methylene tetrahydromethanopterin reductase-like flavin-dependent oxidoreductase (luciferase family)